MGKARRKNRPAGQRHDQPHGQAHRRPGGGAAGSAGSAPPPNLVELVWAGMQAVRRPSRPGDDLLAALGASPGVYLPVIHQQLALLVRRLWDRGWLPYDVVRFLGRSLDEASLTALGALVIGGAEEIVATTAVDPRWESSLAAAAALVAADEPSEPTEPSTVAAWLRLLDLVDRLPALAVLVPPPGALGLLRRRVSGTVAATSTVDQRQLDRVRALLAKAESTTFPAEAEALTAKAQELIARHSLEHALAAGAGPDGGEALGVRVWLEEPYLDAKVILLSRVAAANRCSCVQSVGMGCATLFGFPHDLDAVELLFASLLAQATGAMTRHGSVRDVDGTVRTRSFRRSFLLGFAYRVGERLRVANLEQEQEADVASGGALLPVLTSRHEQVEAAQRAAFSNLVSRSTSVVSNGAGWHAGRVAADLAHLGPDGPALGGG